MRVFGHSTLWLSLSHATKAYSAITSRVCMVVLCQKHSYIHFICLGMVLKCTYSFCAKTFRTEKGRNAHYRSAEGRFHAERTATNSMKRKFSDCNDPSRGTSIEENANAVTPEDEATDPRDDTLDQLELEVDDDLGILLDKPLILDTASEDSRFSDAPACSMFVENYPGAAEIINTGPNMYAQLLEADSEHSEGRGIVGPWYPFAGRAEWELAKWLNSAHLSMNKMDEFLRLDYVSSTTLIITLELLERAVIVLFARCGNRVFHLLHPGS